MKNSIIRAIESGAFTQAGVEIAKAGEKLSRIIRQAGGMTPNIAALNEIASGYREANIAKNRLGEYANYLAEGFNSAHPEHPAYWHQNGGAGAGSPAAFYPHPCPRKAAQAGKAVTSPVAETAPATVADAETATDTDTIELDGSMVLEALRLALEGGVVTLAEVEAVCLGVASRMAA